MIVDAHNHIGEIVGVRHTADELVEHMDQAGVDKSVVFTWPQWPDNNYVAQATRDHPDRLIPFACVNPWSPNALDELRGLLEGAGFRGLKLHPFLHGYALDHHVLVDPIFAECEKHGVPILAHGLADNPFTMPLQFEQMARAFPHVPLIMAHSGFMWRTVQAMEVARRCPNIFLETSGTDVTDVRDFVVSLGPERVVMGTDTPYAFQDLELTKIHRAVEDPQARRLVTGGNLLQLLGFGASS